MSKQTSLSPLVFQLQVAAADELQVEADEPHSPQVFQLQVVAADELDVEADKPLSSSVSAASRCC